MTYPNYTGLTDPKVDKEYSQTMHVSDLATTSIEYGVIRIFKASLNSEQPYGQSYHGLNTEDCMIWLYKTQTNNRLNTLTSSKI